VVIDERVRVVVAVQAVSGIWPMAAFTLGLEPVVSDTAAP
jgi:hypothetical protein